MQTLPLLILGYIALIFVPSFAEKLQLVQVVFRHGDRAPHNSGKKIYTLDPHLNATWYPEGWGGLTNGGKIKAYELGGFLKERYGKWLGNVYTANKAVFRSSVVDRSMMTTQVVAAGLFPPSDIQRWNSELDWQPIPVFSDLSSTKNLFRSVHNCPKYTAMRTELERTDEFLLNRTEEMTEVFEYVSRNVGTEGRQELSAFMYHYLQAELNENMELPEWAKNIFPDGEILERIASYDYFIQSYNKSMIQLNGGLWIREWLENVDSYLNGSLRGNSKGIFYGGHEVNIAGLLVALGVFEQHVPFYCSAVIFELSEAADDEIYVKVLYRNRGILRELVIPGCGDLNCPLTTFRKLFADIITVEDVAAVCERN